MSTASPRPEYCPCHDETLDPCPACGATVSGKDAVRGVCQARKGYRRPADVLLCPGASRYRRTHMSTASPRDIIADALRGPQPSVQDSEAFTVSKYYDAHMVSAAVALSALAAAGYRVVREGDLDAATVERCAHVAENSDYFPSEGVSIAASIRALVGEAK